MSATMSNVNQLVDEYVSFVAESIETDDGEISVNCSKLRSILCNSGDWTMPAAKALIRLAQENGSFMLRNALALSLALGIEDGERGF